MSIIKKLNCIRNIKKKSSSSLSTIRSQIKNAEDKFNISFDEFYRYKLWDKTDTQIARSVLNNHRKEKTNANNYKRIKAVSGKGKETVDQEMKAIKRNYGIKLELSHYLAYGLYSIKDYNDDYAQQIINSLRTTLNQQEELVKLLIEVDNGTTSYEDLREKIETYYRSIEGLISEGEITRVTKKIKKGQPGIEDNPDECKRIAVDMLVSRELLGFTNGEYISYHFYEKNIAEKRSFVSSKDRARAIKLLNSDKARDTLDNKYAAYCALKKYYGREMIMLNAGSESDYKNFVDYCHRHKKFVKKNTFDSLGRGVELKIIDDDTDLRALYKEVTDDFGPVIVEGLIDANDIIKGLNKDSVNTVRVIVYINNGVPEVHYTFMKVGRAGSFVDNGGAGGIIVHIDKESGIFDSNGIDEDGIVYEKHPDHGYEFKGVQMPEWEQLLSLAREAALQIEGLGYVGWDFTYTADNQWIIIEGNSMTQFIAQQGTINTGLKEEFYNKIGFRERIAEK